MSPQTAAVAAATAADIDADDEVPSLSTVAAVARWRGWAEQVAAGGPTPPSRALIDASVLLDIVSPAERLAADAALIREVRDLETRARAISEQVEAARAEYGGMDGLRKRITELKAELARAERLNGIHPRSLQAGAMSGQASRIRNSRPDLFERPKVSTKSKGNARRATR